MILRIIRWLRGYVVFEIIGRFPERFINLSLRRGKFIFSAKPCADKFIASLLLCDYRDIRHTAKKASVRLRVLERHGLPFIIKRYRSRAGLLIGAVLFLIITLLMQSFVWTIEINGITTISESTLLELLEEEGLYCGAFKHGTDLTTLQRDVMKQIDEIGWMSVNIIGTKAEVEIKEKEIKPHILEADVPCNIKASYDGIILRMNTKYGTAVTAPGSAVIEGSLLVSGVNENPSGGVSLVHADAQVIAQTRRTACFTVDRQGQTLMPTNNVSRYKLRAFWLEIPVSFESVGGYHTSDIKRYSVVLNNTAMPFGITAEQCTEFEEVSYSLDRDTAHNILRLEDYLYRLFALSDCETLTAEATLSESLESYSSHILYDCIEDIAIEENIIVNP
ncbi:MAG: sporulation protein YqfD [Ruminococcus sp.]|nr:sporulation protein YqfD [Ruminococcus sp.]